MTTLKKFSPGRRESIQSKFLRWLFNFYPAYLGTGASLLFLSENYREVHLKVGYSWRTRDHRGALFSGSLYGAVDPVFTVMLEHNLGPSYTVRDREANIRYEKPAHCDLFARFEVSEEEVERIRHELDHHDSVTRVYKVELTDESGEVYATVDKTVDIERNS